MVLFRIGDRFGDAFFSPLWTFSDLLVSLTACGGGFFRLIGARKVEGRTSLPFGLPLALFAAAKLSRPADSVAIGSLKCTDLRLEVELFAGAGRSGVALDGWIEDGRRSALASRSSCSEGELSSSVQED